MKNKLIIILICCVLFITGCNDTDKELLEQVYKEKFSIGHTFDDGRHISFTFDVPYNDGYLSEAFLYDNINLDDFIDKLEYVAGLYDGGSILYRYNKVNELFGNEDFYVLVCNGFSGIRDIFLAKNIDSLTDKCIIKIDDLDGVSMKIKEGTLTRSGASLIITDVSTRENIYGEEYRIDKFVNNEWVELDVIVKGNYAWTSIGYSVGENNKLELDVNWEWLYGKLEPGKYRIVKGTSEALEGTKHYITAEFEIK